MMIGDRERHCHLTIGLLAKLPAVLVMHTNRVAALLGERRIIDNPHLDRFAALDRRHHHLAHFGQHRLVQPWRFSNEMQQLLMLYRNLGRRRRRRHRLHALAALRSHKTHTIVISGAARSACPIVLVNPSTYRANRVSLSSDSWRFMSAPFQAET